MEESHFAESLLILGLEGSRDGKPTLWVFNLAVSALSLKGVGRSESKWARKKRKGEPALGEESPENDGSARRVSAPRVRCEMELYRNGKIMLS